VILRADQLGELVAAGCLSDDDAYVVHKFAEFLKAVGPPPAPIPDYMWRDAEWREFLGITDEFAGWRAVLLLVTAHSRNTVDGGNGAA
jgi:hypothetical protein